MAQPVPPIAAPWKDLISDTPVDMLDEVSPPASLTTLVALNLLVHRALSQPYPVAALGCDVAAAGGARWHWGQRINAGAAYMQARYFVGLIFTPGAATVPDSASYSSSSGVSAASQIDIEVGSEGTVSYPPGSKVVEFRSSETYDGAPGAAMDRLYELNSAVASGSAGEPSPVSALADDKYPYTEAFEGSGFHGMSALWVGISDMTTL